MIQVINLNILISCIVMIKKIKNGNIKTSSRIFIPQETGSKSGENTMDEIYAWD